MATLANFVEALSIVTEVELGELKLVARTLREDGQLPQYGRGLHAAELEPMHVASLVTGMLVGRKVPVHRIAENVRAIGERRKGDAIALRQESTDSNDDKPIVLLPAGGSFVRALSDIFSAHAQSESSTSWHGVVLSVGIKFGSGVAYPWIQIKDPARIAIGLTNADRCCFGPSSLLHRVDTGGLTEEGQILNGVLLDVAMLLRDRVSEQISFLQKKHARARKTR